MKPFSALAVAVFTLIALAQLLRVVLGWDIAIHGAVVPIWASLVVSAAAAVLAVMVSREARS